MIDGLDETASPAGSAPSTQTQIPSWPLLTASLVGTIALIVASVGTFVWSVAAYVVVLVLGCGLLFVHRVQVVAMTRRASRPAPSGVSRRERAAIVFLLAASLANGLVIGMDLARR